MTGTERGSDEASTELQSGVVRERFDWSSVKPSTAVVETVAAVAERDHGEIEPLYESVDPDALDALIADSSREACVSMTLTLAGYEVHLRSDGDVVVTDALA